MVCNYTTVNHKKLLPLRHITINRTFQRKVLDASKIVLMEVLDGGTCFNVSDIVKALLRGYHRD